MKETPGTLHKKATVAGMNPRKSMTKPYVSKTIPTTGHPIRTMSIPKKKAPEAFSLCHWKKKKNVRLMPMMKARPAMNSRLPMANSPLSNRKRTPKKRKEIPKADMPRPIFCVSLMLSMIGLRLVGLERKWKLKNVWTVIWTTQLVWGQSSFLFLLHSNICFQCAMVDQTKDKRPLLPSKRLEFCNDATRSLLIACLWLLMIKTCYGFNTRATNGTETFFFSKKVGEFARWQSQMDDVWILDEGFDWDAQRRLKKNSVYRG